MDFLKILRFQWDRVFAWVAIALGVLALLLGWLGVSREVLPAAQIPYIVSGGLGGVFLLGLGAVLWLSADLRDEWRQLREINVRLGETSLDQGGRASIDGPGVPAINTTDDGSAATDGARGTPDSPKTTRTPSDPGHDSDRSHDRERR
jgi:hypothetical protein